MPCLARIPRREEIIVEDRKCNLKKALSREFVPEACVCGSICEFGSHDRYSFVRAVFFWILIGRI